MTIAGTIRALKPGDRVRVTFEDTVGFCGGAIEGIPYAMTHARWVIRASNPTITSIEVIDAPFKVGDRVVLVRYPNERVGTLTALGKNNALVIWDNSEEEIISLLTDLWRAS